MKLNNEDRAIIKDFIENKLIGATNLTESVFCVAAGLAFNIDVLTYTESFLLANFCCTHNYRFSVKSQENEMLVSIGIIN